MTIQPDRSEQFKREGYISPVAALEPHEAETYLKAIESYEARTGERAAKTMRGKAHLKLIALYDLVRHPKVLDAVESVIGPDILCWNSSLFIKDGRDLSYVAWHQDVYDFDAGCDRVVTAWVALLPSTIKNGAMQVIPRSHLTGLMSHVQTPANMPTMLRDNLELAVAVDQSQAVTFELERGQLSLHHMYIHHGSPPNQSGERRCGFAIRYLAPDAGPEDRRYAATLVRGKDDFGHFAKDPVPARDLDPGIIDYVEKYGKPRLPG